MAQVLGIGGVFFKAQDAAGVGEWYRRVLGFEIAEWGGAVFPPLKRGHHVWSPFEADTTYFQPGAAPFMVNFVVDDLDGVLEKARTEGVEPVGREDGDANGRFAWLVDPAGVKIELWEPNATTPFT